MTVSHSPSPTRRARPVMGWRVAAGSIEGVRVLPLHLHEDERGCFRETYRREWLPDRPPMVQGNRSDSRGGVLRGLHFHARQSDYWYAVAGWVVAGLADLRPGSPTRGAVATLTLTGAEGLYIPPGVAHGYMAPVDATLAYLVDAFYDPGDEHGVAWDDPDLAVPWPLRQGTRPILSQRDRENPLLREVDPSEIPGYFPDAA